MNFIESFIGWHSKPTMSYEQWIKTVFKKKLLHKEKSTLLTFFTIGTGRFLISNQSCNFAVIFGNMHIDS